MISSLEKAKSLSASTVQWSFSTMPWILYLANKPMDCLCRAQVGHRTGMDTATVPDRETRVISAASS